MTQRLYEEDSYCREFTGAVLSCVPTGDGYDVILDRTAFFPQGGGQAADTGWLAQARVLDVFLDEEGCVHHRTDKPLETGSAVEGRLDWTQRFLRMQKHTGEHIVSGLIHRLYGLHNVGFHLGQTDVTLDVSGELNRSQMNAVEDEANAAVTANVPVTAAYPPPEQLSALQYRSRKNICGPVRLVTVEGYDVCACCAPHVRRTGEIGVIKLLDAIRYKGGTRIHLQCGADALEDYRMRYVQTAQIAAALSVKQEQAAEAVQRLIAQRDDLSRQLKQANRRMALAGVLNVPEGSANPCLLLETFAEDFLRELVVTLERRCVGRCAIFVGQDGQGYRFAVAGGKELPSFVQRMTQVLQGSGGGSPELMQGRVAAQAAAIRSFWDNETAVL